MKLYVSAAKASSARSSIRLNSKSNRDLLDALTQDMLYQTFENYPDCNLDDAYEYTLDHVILAITEMDDEEEPMYSSLLPFANHENEEFCNMVKRIVNDHYDDFNWYDEV